MKTQFEATCVSTFAEIIQSLQCNFFDFLMLSCGVGWVNIEKSAQTHNGVNMEHLIELNKAKDQGGLQLFSFFSKCNCTRFITIYDCQSCWNNWVQFTTEQPEAENNWLSFTFLLKRKFICQLFCAFLLKRTKSLTWINFKKKVLLCSLSEYMLRQVWTKNPKQCFSKLLLSITPVPSFRVRGLLQK